jgi:hypothetical protein
VLGVVQPAQREARVDRVRVGHDRLHVVRVLFPTALCDP